MINICWWIPPIFLVRRTLPVFQATFMSLLLRFLVFERDLGVLKSFLYRIETALELSYVRVI